MSTKDHPLDYRAIAEACDYVGNGPVTTEMITKTISTLKEAVGIWQTIAIKEGKLNKAMAKLLDSVPHVISHGLEDDCPACQWEKLKSAAA